MGRMFEKRKHKIFARNAKLAKTFTRIGREISIAVKQGGPDPDTNARLRVAVQNARGANMPKENIERAIKKAAGGEDGDLFELTFEGYAPGGVAVFVEATSNNNNRTVANVRSYFSKSEGQLGTNGSLSHMFDRKGVFEITNEALADRDPDEIEMELIDGGAEDVTRDEDGMVVYTAFEDFGSLQQKLDELGISAQSAEPKRFALSTSACDLESAKKVMKLIDLLEEDEDVGQVYHNMDLSEDVMTQLSEEA
jgi:YebC/PmpR family DNA-binding regulatory protein